MSKFEHVTTLVVGDWSGDGHDKKDATVIRANLDSKQIMKAYKKASEKLGFNFIDDVAADYEDRILSRDRLKTLLDNGLDLEVLGGDYEIKEAKECLEDEDSEGVSLWIDSYRDIFLFIVKLGNDSFEWEESHGDSLNIGGYGLFE